MQAELENLSLVGVTGRCDRVQEVAPWRRMLREYRAVALSLCVPVIVPLAFLLWLLLRHTGY